MPKSKALATTISYLPAYNSGNAVTLIGALKSIGEITSDSEEIDVTTLDSPLGYREFIQGMKDSGDLPLTGLHDKTLTSQATMRTLFGTGASGYYWVTFPDGTVVAFTAYVKNYTTGAPDLEGLVTFGATLRISGLVQVLTILDAVAQAKSAGQTATMDSLAVSLAGTPAYQWYSNDENNYTTPTIINGETAHDYTTGALGAGTYYYFCVVTVANHRPVNSRIHVITVT